MSADDFVQPLPTTDDSTEKAENTAEPAKKKRKKNDTFEDIKEKAKAWCKTPEEWLAVQQLSRKKLEEFVQRKEFESSKEFSNQVFSFMHGMLALVLDTVSRGDGYVKEEIMNDLSLRESIELECKDIVHYLHNKTKLILLSSIDVYNGKCKEIANRPDIEEVVEEEEKGSATSGDLGEAARDAAGGEEGQREKPPVL